MPAYQGAPGSAVKLWPRMGSATMAVPCGSCVGCRADRASEWSRRCMHEASLYPRNCFLTLTYSDGHLPDYGFLCPLDLQLFIKRLRKRKGAGIRFFGCGEYGDVGNRPHYHVLLFNCSFEDAVPCGKSLFESATVSKLWEYGKHTLGECTAASANYVAQYTAKKQYGLAAREEYAVSEDGEVVYKVQPFLRMSNRPGIGAPWLERYREDLKRGFLVVDGEKCAIPRAYVERLKSGAIPGGPALADDLVSRRAEVHRENFNPANVTPERLAAAEVIHVSRSNLYKSRSL